MGGRFQETASGEPLLRVGWWDGESFHSMGNGTNNIVTCLAFENDKENGLIYVGGGFSHAGSVHASKVSHQATKHMFHRFSSGWVQIASWSRAHGWGALSKGLDGGDVYALVVDGDKLYVGGQFTK